MDALALGMAGVFNILFCCFYLFFIILGIVAFILWLWMLIDVVQRKDDEFGPTSDANSKLLWIIIILLANGLGALIYYFLIYRKYPRT